MKEKNECILFIGGDLRQTRAINRMSDYGEKVCVFGFDKEPHMINENVEQIERINDIYNEYRAIVLPLPYTIDGNNINAPLCSCEIKTADIIKNVSQKSLLLVGKSDERIKTMCEIYGVKAIDYYCRDELKMYNAIPTAEGAIEIAMAETPHTLHNSHCLVVGNGRIGKVLAKMLAGIGARVTVAARKQRDFAEIETFGYSKLPIRNMQDYIEKFDIVFNTAPVMLIDEDMLRKIKRSTLIIDLASKPGGVDFDAAGKLGIRVIWALSLPGKVAPDTAGDIIKETLLNILEEMEV